MARPPIACAALLAAMLTSCATGPVASVADVYVADRDADGDGVDDASDIVASARAYVGTRPSYGSAYYAGGRPDDGRGVCTDVVDQALLGAGYDLKTLVDEDVDAAPSAYPDIEVPDANIDFRRVRNLRTYFDRHARSLTLDPTDADGWQQGDIVCWPDHIGIVSDRRVAGGRPLIIHHAGPFQLSFEEDVLASSIFGPICGHWRLS